jgi:hypothetical protein
MKAVVIAAILVLFSALTAAQAREGNGIVVVVVWPAAGAVKGVGVNGKVVWPPAQAGRKIPRGNVVIVWPRAQPRR